MADRCEACGMFYAVEVDPELEARWVERWLKGGHKRPCVPAEYGFCPHAPEQAEPKCNLCKDKGRVLQFYDRPGSPSPGNGYVPCPECQQAEPKGGDADSKHDRPAERNATPAQADVEAAAPTVDDLPWEKMLAARRQYGQDRGIDLMLASLKALQSNDDDKSKALDDEYNKEAFLAMLAASDMVLVERDVVKALVNYLESLSELFEAGSDEWARLLDRALGLRGLLEKADD